MSESEENKAYCRQEYSDLLQDKSPKLLNSEILWNLSEKLRHLRVAERNLLSESIEDFRCLFSDVPRSKIAKIDNGDVWRIKQNFYRMNLYFAEFVHPLRELLKKKNKFSWTPEYRESFLNINEKLRTGSELQAPDFNENLFSSYWR